MDRGSHLCLLPDPSFLSDTGFTYQDCALWCLAETCNKKLTGLAKDALSSDTVSKGERQRTYPASLFIFMYIEWRLRSRNPQPPLAVCTNGPKLVYVQHRVEQELEGMS